MSQVLIKSSRLKLGYSIHVQAWWQICAGIIMEYKPKDKWADFDLEDLQPETDLLLDAAHFQAGHTTATANVSCGNAVNN